MRDHRSTDAAPRGRETNAGMIGVALALLVLAICVAPALAQPATDILDPNTIPKYVSQLNGPPPVYDPVAQTTAQPIATAGKKGDQTPPVVTGQSYHVTMSEIQQQMLPPGFPMTKVWAYGGNVTDVVTGQKTSNFFSTPGPSFVATRGVPFTVTYTNNIDSPYMFPVDPTIMWADPTNLGMVMPPMPWTPIIPEAQTPVPLVPHLHGGEVQSTSDGNPRAWFTAGGLHGPDYNTAAPTDPNSAVYYYPNSQQSAPLWYHDHALGLTRLNVASGLAGGYLVRDPNDPLKNLLPSGKYQFPLVLQDRTFYTNGSLFFTTVGDNPDVHPYWDPEFFGNTIIVNGKVWPNLNVDRGQYRFILYGGSNARFYNLSLDVINPSNKHKETLPLVQIASDGGYLPKPVTLNNLTLAPGERAEVLVDFSKLQHGTTVIVRNDANTPFPSGDPVDPNTTGQVMQFTVTKDLGFKAQKLPATLNTMPVLTPTNTRQEVLFEKESDVTGNPLAIYLNGLSYDAPVTENPAVGTTEEWDIVNPTMDTHPIHLHLIQFEVLNRQKMDTDRYMADWIALNAGLSIAGDGTPPWSSEPQKLDVTSYLIGTPTAPDPNEQGWKDTVRMNPGEITRIRARWTAQDGSPFTFDPTVGPGYVWHCHIIDHEDNEMMRPYVVT